jgi:hypothetical protein
MSTGIQTARENPMQARGNIVVLGLPTAAALWFLYAYAMPYVGVDAGQLGIYQAKHDWLYAHIIAGTVALLAGPVQLWLGLNRRAPLVHRILGVLYVLAVGVSGTAAFYLATHTDFGWVFGTGLTAMAFVWVVTTAFAAIAIGFRQIDQHREWVIRSYVVTFAFVTFRILEFGLDLAKVGTLVERMTAASWLSWSVPLFITEAILQGQKLFARKRPVVQVVEEPPAYNTAIKLAKFEPREILSISTSRIAEDTASGFSLGKK